MKKESVVINLLAFVEDFQKGMQQLEMIKKLYAQGYHSAEVRREFFIEKEKEIPKIGKFVEENNVCLFYSVPEALYTNEVLNYKEFELYCQEAHAMHCQYIKLIVGDYGSVSSKDMADINRLCSEYKLKLTVENDQTMENGVVDKIFKFLMECKKEGGDVGTTFDVGNWIWVKEDPLENAKKLKDFVWYIHIKDVSALNEPKAVYLEEGIIPVKEVLEILPKKVPVALEYPMGESVIEVLEEEYTKLQKIGNELTKM